VLRLTDLSRSSRNARSTPALRSPMPAPSGIRPTWRRRVPLAAAAALSTLLLVSTWSTVASAATTVQLGSAGPFAVLAGSEVTDVPTSVITGDVGLSPAPGSAYAGLTQAEVTGTIFATDTHGPGGSVANPALLTTAQNDLTTAYNSAAAQPPTSTFSAGDNQLGGKTLTGGVYAFGHAATANITAASPLTLDGQGDPNAVFVFQASSDLVTASNSVVQLENGARACNVFWQVSSSATLNSSSTFVGTIMALTSATLSSRATVQGRVLARNAAVTLDANTITAPGPCAVVTSTTSTTGPTGITAATVAPGTTSTASGGGPTTGAGGTAGTTPTAAPTTTSAVIPLGYPHTGLGGASLTEDRTSMALGALAVAASVAAFALAFRRRDDDRPSGVRGS